MLIECSFIESASGLLREKKRFINSSEKYEILLSFSLGRHLSAGWICLPGSTEW